MSKVGGAIAPITRQVLIEFHMLLFPIIHRAAERRGGGYRPVFGTTREVSGKHNRVKSAEATDPFDDDGDASVALLGRDPYVIHSRACLRRKRRRRASYVILRRARPGLRAKFRRSVAKRRETTAGAAAVAARPPDRRVRIHCLDRTGGAATTRERKCVAVKLRTAHTYVPYRSYSR